MPTALIADDEPLLADQLQRKLRPKLRELALQLLADQLQRKLAQLFKIPRTFG